MIPGIKSIARPIPGLNMLDEVDEALKGVENKDLLIYIHVPFCNSKCVFCDWVADIPVANLKAASTLGNQYVKAICAQIRSYGPKLAAIGYTPKYIYWGGGTPSRLEPEQIVEIVNTLRESFDLSSLVQHAMETSPETLTIPKLEAIKKAGVQRLSMGVQSFNNAELRRSARSHSAEQAIKAVGMIREVGIEDFNLDLIAALPGQTMEMLEYSIQRTIELAPPHISLYVYRPDPRTVMAKQSNGGCREIVDLQKMKNAYERAKQMLKDAGNDEYTTFYFAREPRFRFRGEMYYFELRGDYVGFGSGAYSILGHRFLKNVSDLHSYMDNPLDFEYCEQFSARRPDKQLSILLSEAVLTQPGINYKNFERLTGFNFSEIRRHPYFEVLMQYYSDCGGEFRETAESLSVTPESRSKAHITHLAGIYEAGRLKCSVDRAHA
jgi:putative oxygen-independent coproporphyrinogen III oxidase